MFIMSQQFTITLENKGSMLLQTDLAVDNEEPRRYVRQMAQVRHGTSGL